MSNGETRFIFCLSSTSARPSLDEFVGIILVHENLVSQPRFGQTFPENQILLAKKIWIRDLRPVPPGSLRLCSILESGPSGDLCSICKSDHPFSTHIGILHCDHRCGNSQFCQTFAENAGFSFQMHKFQSRQSLLRCPSRRDSMSGACFPHLRPRASVVLGVRGGTF